MNRPGVGAFLNKRAAKVSDICFGLRVTNHWIACIPRQRHSNRPWYSLVKPVGGWRRGTGVGSEPRGDEMDMTDVCFIFSCKYKLKRREWRSLCLLNYFYCFWKKKNKEWMVMFNTRPRVILKEQHHSSLREQYLFSTLNRNKFSKNRLQHSGLLLISLCCWRNHK